MQFTPTGLSLTSASGETWAADVYTGGNAPLSFDWKQGPLAGKVSRRATNLSANGCVCGFVRTKLWQNCEIVCRCSCWHASEPTESMRFRRAAIRRVQRWDSWRCGTGGPAIFAPCTFHPGFAIRNRHDGVKMTLPVTAHGCDAVGLNLIGTTII